MVIGAGNVSKRNKILIFYCFYFATLGALIPKMRHEALLALKEQYETAIFGISNHQGLV